MNWDLRTCARRGHVVHTPDEEAPRAAVRAETSAGELWQCLRCAGFVVPGDGDTHTRGPVTDVPEVARGRELRDLFVLRLLAVERVLRGLVLIVLAYGAWRFRSAQAGLREGFRTLLPDAQPLADRLGVDLQHASVVAAAQRLLAARPAIITAVAAALLGYGLLQLVEGAGLWLAKRWGEYVAVVATSAFLPLEVYEVVEGASPVKAVTLALNVAVVVWLVTSKRLFGVRGGHEAYVAARRGEVILDPSRYQTPAADPQLPTSVAG